MTKESAEAQNGKPTEVGSEQEAVEANAITKIFPDDWEINDIKDESRKGEIRFSINADSPFRVEDRSSSQNGAGKTYAGWGKEWHFSGTLDEIETAISEIDERMRNEVKAHQIAEGIMANDTTVQAYIEEQKRKEAKEERERADKEAEEKERKDKEAEEAQRKKEIKDSYQPDWWKAAVEKAAIDEGREAERQRFYSAWGLTPEQGKVIVSERNIRNEPFLELSFDLASVRVQSHSPVRGSVPVPERSWKFEEWDDKDLRLAEALADVLDAECEERIQFYEDWNSEPDRYLLVRSGGDYVIFAKEEAQWDDY